MKKIVFAVVLLLAAPVFGQSTGEPGSQETTAQAEVARASEAPAATSAVEGLRERIRRAIRLPRTAQDSREEGVPEERVREVLRTSRERRIPAGDAQAILEAENAAIRAGADKDNFGAAVQSMKESGLRGRELAEAIHAEQVARGMKKPKGGAYGKNEVQHKAKGKGKARRGGDR